MKIILFIFIMSMNFSQANEIILKRAVIRDEHFHAKIDDVELVELLSDHTYEGKYFKIVHAKNNEAISFEDSEELQLKAATVYYHLMKAHKFFTDTIKAKYVEDMPQVIVRIDLTNVFNEVGHFANDRLDPQYNNALSVPGGNGYEPANIKPWKNEIWFRPSKEINVADLGASGNVGAVKSAMVTFRNQAHMANLQQFFVTLINGGLNNGINSSNMMRFVGTSLILEAIYQSSGIAAEFFERKIYKLDTALVPEIIYHEFSHIALSDHLQLTHSTPVNEGLADYFAGKIANSKQLATKIKDYNLFSGKKVEKKQQYRLQFESGEYANADFVFGLLWNVGQTVGEDIEANFMYNMASSLSTNVSIKDDLINATLDTCRGMCKSPLNDRIKLYKLYNSKNL